MLGNAIYCWKMRFIETKSKILPHHNSVCKYKTPVLFRAVLRSLLVRSLLPAPLCATRSDLDADIVDKVARDRVNIRPAVEVHKDIRTIVDSHDSACLCISARCIEAGSQLCADRRRPDYLG